MISYLPPSDIQYGEYLLKIFPEKFHSIEDIKTITFQVTEDCCLKCSYCYQVHQNKKMTFDIAKTFLDNLFADKYCQINKNNTKAIIWEFIGGEPFLEIDLISKITDYIFQKMLSMNHPWLEYCKISISSNGILYFDKKVQEYLFKYKGFVHIGISVDGNKELHDSCRVDLNGKGSYDRVISAVRQYKKDFGEMPGIKMTFSPDNVRYIYDSVISLIQEGYTIMHANCVYEEGWTEKEAKILYLELKKVADYLIENNLYNKINFSFFDENMFHKLDEEDNQNWCGGVGCQMLSIDYKGNLYPCIRYMESALQDEREPIIIGDILNGIDSSNKYHKNWESLQNITRKSQSSKECFNCPIAAGCAWCSAYNYQKTGSVNKRVTYICIMHKARALANAYYWNKLYNYLNINKKFKINLPEEECLKIISKEELNFLYKIGGA